jgi:hypothetical protein
MSLAGFLQGMGVVSKTRTREVAKAGKKYGVIPGTNLIRAPSGVEALRIAGTDGMTPAGNKYVACNHKGNGVYEIRVEDW